MRATTRMPRFRGGHALAEEVAAVEEFSVTMELHL